jgi:hypothetical protein
VLGARRHYLLTADPSGAGVATLLVFGGAPATPTATAPGADLRLVEAPGLRGRPPIPALEEPVPEPPEEDPLEPPLEVGNEAPGAPPPDSFSGAVEAMTQGAAGAAPAAPEVKPLFPSSPFNPVPPALAPPAAAPAPPASAQPFQP